MCFLSRVVPCPHLGFDFQGKLSQHTVSRSVAFVLLVRTVQFTIHFQDVETNRASRFGGSCSFFGVGSAASPRLSCSSRGTTARLAAVSPPQSTRLIPYCRHEPSSRNPLMCDSVRDRASLVFHTFSQKQFHVCPEM